MPLHLQREIERLKKELLLVSGMVEENVARSIKALVERDSVLADQVPEMDKEIDIKEIEVEEECLKIIALHQPVAFDLRFISSVLRINRDLERTGDIAVNIARRAKFLNTQMPAPQIHPEFTTAAARAQNMLKQSLDALTQLDIELAKKVCEEDKLLDAICARIFDDVMHQIEKEPDRVETLTQLLMLPRRLERIGDHATNIAEDLIYMIEGEIVRHHGIN
jgi:phosphate transport system protein